MGAHIVDDYIHQSIKSILEQTLLDIELIVVANGPKADLVVDFIGKHFHDTRIRVFSSSIPQLSNALNIAIDNARFDYIARMDADDTALPMRLEKQLSYIIEHGLDLVGSDVNLIDINGNVIGSRECRRGASINRFLGFTNAFIHPTVLYRKEIILKARGYNGGFNSEDYDLWLRLSRLNIKWDNMPEKLLNYRVHDNATQGHKLGYAEVAGYLVREFLLKKSFYNFLAILFNVMKALTRGR
jgi:glycosyltransferase involved in cell wall biosynthesis